MTLFDTAIDYSKDVFRNIRSIKKSQNLFDDLSPDPKNWEAAISLDINTHPALKNEQLIQRGFDYSQNEFITFPFENITASRFSNGSNPCWYGGEDLITTIYETSYHFIQEIQSSYDVFKNEEEISIDRRVALVNCHGLAFDLSDKTNLYPWLIDKSDYTKCQEVGIRVADEGHPLLKVASARKYDGINIVVFKQKALSNVRDYCNLQYVYNIESNKVKVLRGDEELKCVI
ncbi:MAG: RES family NAD+ phosphorylase [Legionellaceae bacterium]|nr:RES family NAD+ phosphorylase [Legionellaceae bacterium]